jgi:outer membrane protein assembly factor BamB
MALRAAPILAALVAASLALPAPVRAGDPPPPPAAAELTPAEAKKVDTWIGDLDHRDFLVREAAMAGLRTFGARGLARLREAAKSGSEETRARARLLVLVLEAGAAEVEGPEGWATLKGDMGRTSARGPGPVKGPAVRFSRHVGAGRGGRGPDAPLACAEGTVVAVEGDRVTALRSEDLSYRWSAGLGSPALSSPVIAGGTVYLGTARGLTALRLEDGKERWTVAAAYGVGAAPLVSGSTLFACLGDEAIVALDPVTGDRRWEHRCPAGRAAPVLAGGRVVTGLRSAEVLALDAATGKPAWRIPVEGAISFAPAAVGSSVIVGDGGRRLRCIDAESGRVLWTRSVKGRFLGDGPAVTLRAIVFALDSLEVEAYDPATGRRLWSRWVGTLHLSSPSLAGPVVLFGSRTRLVALEAATGDDAWQAELEGDVGCPVVADGSVFAMAGQRVVAMR